jgi:NADH:ubiquinone oxidoreductase subunit C
MNVELILESLREAFSAEPLEPQAVPIDETFVALPPDCIHAAARLLIERFDLRHLSAITGEDVGGEIVLLYHFWDGQGLTLRTSLPRENARIATLTGLILGAAFYEREVSEMLGVAFDGHPTPPALLLPDDWDGEPPLLRTPSPSPAASGGTPSLSQVLGEGGGWGVGEGQEETE